MNPAGAGGSPTAVGASSAPVRAAVGIDVGGTKLLGVRLQVTDGRRAAAGVELKGWELTEVKVGSPASGEELTAQVVEVIDQLCPAGPSPPSIGIGAPGLVDVDGVLRFSPHLPGAAGTAFVALLGDIYPSSPVWVGNDATAACWAEHLLGAAVGVDDVVLATLGTGIGGGIITSGVLLEGAHRFAGEVGHMVVDPHGPLCPCGQRGCWERLASGSGLGLLGREAALAGQAPRLVTLAGDDPEGERGEHVTVAAAEGDRAAIGIMGRFAWWVALGLANLTNIFDPALVLLGGGLVDAGDVLLGPTRRAFATLVEAGEVRGGPPIEAAALGPRAGAVGAALLAARAPSADRS